MVEIRHRPRRPTNASQHSQWSQVKARPAAFESEAHRLATATIAAAKTPDQPSGDGAASYPTRLLPSLVPEPPPNAQVSEATSRARKPPSPRPARGKDNGLSRLRAQSADGSLVGSVQSSGISATDGATVSPGLAPATSRQLVGESGGPEPRQKAKRKVQTPIALDDSPPAVSAKAQRSVTRKDSPGAGAAAVDHPSHPDRKRTILSRYVFGDALKPGERWKRRLSKGR
jgi:hypothetical protein